MNRRIFLQTTTSATSALMLSSLESFASLHKPDFGMNNNFELKLLATKWDFNGTMDAYCAKVKQKGEVLSVLTEFGPPDYMPTLPYTKQPLADQWAMPLTSKGELKQLFQEVGFIITIQQ